MLPQAGGYVYIYIYTFPLLGFPPGVRRQTRKRPTRANQRAFTRAWCGKRMGAYEKGKHWKKALEAFEDMRRRGLAPGVRRLTRRRPTRANQRALHTHMQAHATSFETPSAFCLSQDGYGSIYNYIYI